MKLVWHIVWKDLRSLRWWLVLWLFVAALPVLDGFMLLYTPPETFRRSDWDAPVVYGFVCGLEVLVAYTLTIVLIHADSLAGSRQFWVTRPIGNGRLFAAKGIAAISILWGVPVLVSVPWWCWCGFTFRQMGAAAAELGLLAGLVCLPAAAIATLTDTIARALLWSLVFLAALLMNFALFATFPLSVGADGGLMTRVVAVTGLLFVELGLIVVARFFLRARVWPVVLVGILTIGSQWWGRSITWNYYSKRSAEVRPERAADVRVQFKRQVITEAVSPEVRRPNDVWKRWRGEFEVQRASTAVPIVPVLVQGVWHWQNGTRTNRMLDTPLGDSGAMRELGLHPVSIDSVTREGAKSHPESYVQLLCQLQDVKDPMIETTVALLPKTMIDRIKAERPKLDVELWHLLGHPRIQLELPLEPGRWRTSDGLGCRIERSSIARGSAEIVLASSSPISLVSRIFRNENSALVEYYTQQRIVPVNWATHEYGRTMQWSLWPIFINGVRVSWQRFSVDGGYVVRDDKVWHRPGWLEHASLAIVTFDDPAIFSRKVEVPASTIEIEK
jgi:Flp pilus assembly pilin Flp